MDGFRLDAVPYLYEREGTNGENLPETHEYLKRVRAEVDAKYPDRVLLAEANQWPADVVEYFGDGDECHMAFHFPVMPRMFMALRREEAIPIYEILRQTPEIPDNCQWGLFLRNHDELTLEMVTDEERDYMYSEYAKDPRMKINVGIRRRLAPLLDNGRDEIELMHAIMFSLPGSPVLYYGDEIAMGDNVYLGDRDGVRTPMQWTGDRNGGFSRADFAQLYAPPLMDPVYGYQAVNVEAQLRTPTSLLRWLRRFIALRKEHPVFGLGTYEPLEPSNPKIFAHLREYEDDVILCVHNLARSAQAVELDLSEYEGRHPVEMFGRSRFPRIGELPYLLTLAPRGFYWFQLDGEDDEWPIRPLSLLDQDALRDWVVGQRWFASKARDVTHVDVLEASRCARSRRCSCSRWSRRASRGHARDLPGAARLAAGRRGLERARDHASPAADRLRRARRPRARARAAAPHAQRLRGHRGGGHAALPLGRVGGRRPRRHGRRAAGRRRAVELVARLRRGADPEGVPALEPGVNPELELLRFLSARGFQNIAPLYGWYEYEGRFIDATLADPAAVLRRRARRLGAGARRDRVRPGRLPRPPARARRGDRPDALGARLGRSRPRVRARRAEPGGALAADRRRRRADRAGLPRPPRDRGRSRRSPAAGRTCGSSSGAVAHRRRRPRDPHARRLPPRPDHALRRGWVILDFEGEPARPLPERRLKRSPLRDVAGMLRSFSYVTAGARLLRGVEPPDGWEDRARGAFLEGYFDRVDPSLLPPGEAPTGQLLAVFELEKAVYELRYELNNRPDWVGIPVAGDPAPARRKD